MREQVIVGHSTVSNFGCDSLTLIISEYIEITAYLICLIYSLNKNACYTLAYYTRLVQGNHRMSQHAGFFKLSIQNMNNIYMTRKNVVRKQHSMAMSCMFARKIEMKVHSYIVISHNYFIQEYSKTLVMVFQEQKNDTNKPHNLKINLIKACYMQLNFHKISMIQNSLLNLPLKFF